MRTIKLNSLSLVNFMGIRSLNIGFSDAETLVAGENGTGKTTVFDSFLWLLFGKDSTGRSDSNSMECTFIFIFCLLSLKQK